MYTGWLLYQDALDASGYDDEFYWFWFDSKGLKYDNPVKKKKINGKHYAFDGFGVMLYEWVDTVTIGNTTLGWFNAAEDGHLAKSTWIWASEEDVLNNGDDDNRWWYADKHGDLITSQTKKINSKWYVFDSYGRMKWGLVWTDKKSVKDTSKIADLVAKDPADVTAEEIYAGELNDGTVLPPYMYLFSLDEEKDGSMKNGQSIKVELYDDDYTLGFDKNSGLALDGIEKNKLYVCGILQAASDNKYDVAEGSNGKLYLVSSNGTRMKATKRTYKDGDDNYYYVEEGTDKDGYTIYVAQSSKAAKGDKDDDVPAREEVTKPTL
jgi:glucan-binding YG repeat protein